MPTHSTAWRWLLACWVCAASAASDLEALVQRSWSRDQTSEVASDLSGATAEAFDRMLQGTNFTLRKVAALAQQQVRTLGQPLEEVLATKEGIEASKPDTERMTRGWHAFRRLAQNAGGTQPHVLLEHAKTALLQTGALAEMRRVARRSAKAMRGAVPLDSMTTGFFTSLAPWNNVLKDFGLPLIKARFMLFANFFGPEGSAARLCISADMAVDSTYGVHSRSEFGGIGVFVGPTKWDNVPGWKFGAEGGVDDIRIFDAADFGWDWTLSNFPETVGFRFLIHVLDSEGLHASVLQQKAELLTAAQSETIPNHGSTYLSHTWCSPDWFNTPLVIADDSPSSTTTILEKEKHFSEEEVWDPAADAV